MKDLMTARGFVATMIWMFIGIHRHESEIQKTDSARSTSFQNDETLKYIASP